MVAQGLNHVIDIVDRARRPWSGRGGKIALTAVLVIAAVLVVVLSETGTGYSNQVLLNAMINTMLVLSLFLIFGLSGQISVGHAAFFGVGAYVSGHLAALQGWPFPFTLLAGAVAGGAIGLVLIPLSRLAVHYFVMTTLGLGLILYTLFGTQTWLTGGWSGLAGIPDFGEVLGVQLSGTVGTPLVVLGFLILEFLLLRILVLGRSGRTFRAIRDDELAAQSIGIRVAVSKAEASILGSIFAGIAGSLSAHVNGFLSPESYGLVPSAYLVLAVVVGGSGSLIGAVVAGIGLPYFTEALTPWPDVSPVIYGSIIVIIMLFMPAGLAGLWQKGVDLVVKWATRVRVKRGEAVAEPPAEQGAAAPVSELLRQYFLPITDDEGAAAEVLVVENARKLFGGIVAVDHVDLSVRRGDIHGIIGPNGAGKSSLFNILTGVTKADQGTVVLNGIDIGGQTPDQRARAGIARTFQNGRLFATMTVFENVLIAVDPHPTLPALAAYITPRKTKEAEAHARQITESILALVGISSIAETQVDGLAYGQRRLVEVARALATRPRILLLDEPAAGLSASDRALFVQLMRSLRDELDLTVLLVEHDLPLINAVCDVVTVLHEGRSIVTAPPRDALGSPEVMAAYMGTPVEGAV